MDSDPCTSVIGLTLDAARAALQSGEQTRDWTLLVVATAPPVRPAKTGRIPDSSSAARAAKKEQKTKFERHPAQWGEWRVLRCRPGAAAAGKTAVELLVAREELGAASRGIRGIEDE
jgi:hypothetical protein